MLSNKDRGIEHTLHFDVSSGLKSVLGSELITDDDVAIFELVKNSFDANASQVDLYFENEQIVIADNGDGMAYDDIRKKWLFVAYSSKRNKVNHDNFRDNIDERRSYAGSKGIGRFSSDRLGQIINIQTRPKKEISDSVHSITVNWNLFEEDQKKHFEEIKISYAKEQGNFVLPKGIPNRKHGTVITITKLRRSWDREALKEIKSALAKLINPFGSSIDGFRIIMHAPFEVAEDNIERSKAEKKGEEPQLNAIVNGEIGNFVFSTLREKTTFIEVRIDTPGKYIESSLIDRGELIYHIKEPNCYPLLSYSNFHCQVFFLNQSAKATFARRMGVPSVQFGSVFLFRNGFRVFPIGSEGDDWYKLDRRKQQGYRRFLGTRDIIGRIDVTDKEKDFEEASSRNAGLIETPAVIQLRKCFTDHCLKRIERYVVPVTFIDKEDKNISDVSRLLTDPGRARVTSAVAKLIDNDKIELIQYSKRLIGILNERSSQFESSLVGLRAIAEKTKDRKLLENIETAEARFFEIKKSEEIALRQADEERKAKEAAEKRAESAEKKSDSIQEQLDEEKKRNLFLSSISTLDTDTIINLHHQVTIYSVDIQQQIENYIVSIAGKASIPNEDAINILERITLLNRKIMGISKFATKANFRLASEKIEADLSEYIKQYISEVASPFILRAIQIHIENDHKGFKQKFKPIDISVLIDNLISNARKAQANNISIKIIHPSKNTIHIYIDDDGKGFDTGIADLDKLFDKGFTTTDGSGLGLFHVRHVLGEMNGTIEAIKSESSQGASFLIRISK